LQYFGTILTHFIVLYIFLSFPFIPTSNFIETASKYFSDTERIYTEITQSIADRYGKTYTWELKQTLMGFTGQDAAKKLVEGIGLPISPEDYIKESHILYNENFPKADLLPGMYNIF
jgi:hypothetical protein